MPSDIKDNREVWTTLESRTKLITLFAKPENAIFSRTSSSTTREQLRVEDLDLVSCEQGTPIPKLNRTSLTLERLECSGRLQKSISSRNFTVYQGGDLNKFFGCDVFTPKRVSEVCLVNDHYILVKIPESQIAQPKMACIQDSSPTSAENSMEPQTSKNFTKYLHCGNSRNRKVSPIPETVNATTAPSTSWSSNGCVQEVFKSRTKITGNLKSAVQNSSSKRTSKQDSRHDHDTNKKPSTEFESSNRQELKAIRKPLQTSFSDQVELEIHGHFETPPCEIQGTKRRSPRKRSLPRPRRSFGLSFRWFLRSFRNRHASKKSKSTTSTSTSILTPTTTTNKKKKKKINAVVHKTFFVSWTNIKHSHSHSHPKCLYCRENTLRRTLSAVF